MNCRVFLPLDAVGCEIKYSVSNLLGFFSSFTGTSRTISFSCSKSPSSEYGVEGLVEGSILSGSKIALSILPLFTLSPPPGFTLAAWSSSDVSFNRLDTVEGAIVSALSFKCFQGLMIESTKLKNMLLLVWESVGEDGVVNEGSRDNLWSSVVPLSSGSSLAEPPWSSRKRGDWSLDACISWLTGLSLDLRWITTCSPDMSEDSLSAMELNSSLSRSTNPVQVEGWGKPPFCWSCSQSSVEFELEVCTSAFASGCLSVIQKEKWDAITALSWLFKSGKK